MVAMLRSNRAARSLRRDSNASVRRSSNVTTSWASSARTCSSSPHNRSTQLPSSSPIRGQADSGSTARSAVPTSAGTGVR